MGKICPWAFFDFGIFKYSNMQTFEYMNMQIIKYTNIQIYKYSNIQIFKYSNNTIQPAKQSSQARPPALKATER